VRTNLYKVVGLPEKVQSVGCNLTFTQALDLLKDKPVIFYPRSLRLYFFGKKENVEGWLGNKQSGDFTEHKITAEFISQNWYVLSVLLYKGLRSYLWEKGFLFHGRKGTRAYMVRHKTYGSSQKIVMMVHDYSDADKKAYVHEGFTFFLKHYGEEIYLVIDPCLVITDGNDYIGQGGLSPRKREEYKQNFVDRRYNWKVRSMVDIFTAIMRNGKQKIEIPLQGELLAIEDSPVRIED